MLYLLTILPCASALIHYCHASSSAMCCFERRGQVEKSSDDLFIGLDLWHSSVKERKGTVEETDSLCSVLCHLPAAISGETVKKKRKKRHKLSFV